MRINFLGKVVNIDLTKATVSKVLIRYQINLTGKRGQCVECTDRKKHLFFITTGLLTEITK